MSTRVLVFCLKAVPHLTAEEFRREIDSADLMTLAESLALPEGEAAAVRAMRPHLRIEAPNAVAGDFRYAEVHWKPEGRPIQIRRKDASKGELAEMLESLPPASSSIGAKRVRDHLAATREIVELEMGVNDSLHLGATLAEVLAFYIAEMGDGIVWFTIANSLPPTIGEPTSLRPSSPRTTTRADRAWPRGRAHDGRVKEAVGAQAASWARDIGPRPRPVRS